MKSQVLKIRFVWYIFIIVNLLCRFACTALIWHHHSGHVWCYKVSTALHTMGMRYATVTGTLKSHLEEGNGPSVGWYYSAGSRNLYKVKIYESESIRVKNRRIISLHIYCFEPIRHVEWPCKMHQINQKHSLIFVFLTRVFTVSAMYRVSLTLTVTSAFWKH